MKNTHSGKTERKLLSLAAVLLATLIVAFAFASCGEKANDDKDVAETTAPETKETPEAPEAPEAPETSEVNNDAGKSDFRKAVEKYEALVDEYLEFLDQYTQNPTDESIQLRANEILANANAVEAEINAVDEDSVSADDINFYLEVLERVNDKMQAQNGDADDIDPGALGDGMDGPEK